MKLREEIFRKRLRALKEKHGLTERELAALFGIQYRMVQRLITGDYVPKKAGTMNKYMAILERYEKEENLHKYVSEGKRDSRAAGNGTKGLDFYLSENTTLKEEVESLKADNKTLTTTINFYAEQLIKTKGELEDCRRQLQLEKSRRN